MIRMEDTSGGAVASAIAAERHRQGSPTTGMVLTLLILSDEEFQADATAAAVSAARQHPMRIITLIPRPGRGAPRLDADIMVGGDDGPGEVAVLRLRGELSEHGNSVAIPLLLADTPVVAYWPSDAPDAPSEDPICKHAQRRISDAASSDDPFAALRERASGYRPGDTDLTWTRLTPWRTVLAALFDQRVAPVRGVKVTAEQDNPSAHLLTTWLHMHLNVPVELITGSAPGISRVSFDLSDGELAVERQSEAGHSLLIRPNAPVSTVSVPRRHLDELLSEELRRLDPDEEYGRVLRAFGSQHG